MIRDFRIENYRLFREFALDSLGRVNLVVGPNNSGKSSLLEAIYLLTNEDVPSSLLAVLDERGELVPQVSVDYQETGPRYAGDYEIAHIFHGHEARAEQTVTICSDRDVPQSLTLSLVSASESKQLTSYVKEGRESVGLSVGAKLMVIEHTRPEAGMSKHLLDVSKDGFVGFRGSYRHKGTFPGDNVQFITTSHFGHAALARLWDEITLTPREERVIQALQILEPSVRRISFTSRVASNSGILLKLEGESEPIPLGSMGDGMRRILAMAASLVSVENGILLVDEIDTGLYYATLTDMFRLIFETASKRNAQVFATTHSWDCVRAFQEALDGTKDKDEGLLIRLDEQGGLIRPVYYSKDELNIAIEQDIEVR